MAPFLVLTFLTPLLAPWSPNVIMGAVTCLGIPLQLNGLLQLCIISLSTNGSSYHRIAIHGNNILYAFRIGAQYCSLDYLNLTELYKYGLSHPKCQDGLTQGLGTHPLPFFFFSLFSVRKVMSSLGGQDWMLSCHLNPLWQDRLYSPVPALVLIHGWSLQPWQLCSDFLQLVTLQSGQPISRT